MVFDHKPVLPATAVENLQPRPGGLYVDCTVGGGGHAEALLRALRGEGRLIGLDRDPGAVAAAQERLAPFRECVTLVQENFTALGRVLDRYGIPTVDGILLDLGVSSPQLDHEERGFSYFGHGELDMRMGPDAPKSAAELLAELDVDELTRIIREYGEERWASRIARFIGRERKNRTIKTAADLVEIVKSAIPVGARRHGPHPARKTFQALRIAVNDELGALERVLPVAVDRLSPNGRLVAISFHSLEDRIVKKFLVDEARGCVCPPEIPVCRCGKEPRLRILTRKPLVAGEREREENPRARSAKLRAAERVLVEREFE